MPNIQSPQVLLERKQTNCPLTFVRTAEEYRALNECRHVLLKHKLCKTVYSWNIRGRTRDTVADKGTERFETLFDVIEWYSKPFDPKNGDENCLKDVVDYNLEESPLNKSALFVMDVTPSMFDNGKGHSNPLYARMLKDSLETLMAGFRSIFILSHTPDIPPELEHYCEFIDYELPSLEFAKGMVRTAASTQMVGSRINIPTISLDPNEEEKIGHELLGLTSMEIDECLATANRRNASLVIKNPAEKRQFDMSVIREVKAQAIKRSGTMELMAPPGGLNLVGGMDALKDELDLVRKDLSVEARRDGIPAPKGFIMVGPGGTGKTLVTKCIGSYLDMQIASLDIGACKGSFVGQSESRLRDALEMANKIAPVILFVDEFEKMWAGAGAAAGGSDNGTSANMLQTWLRWMQDGKDENVIVIAACNEVRGMPGPVIRAGRFDDIIYVGLPGAKARKEIFEIHLNKRGWDANDLPDTNTEELASLTKGFSGAEIERCVVKALRFKAQRIGFGAEKRPELVDFRKSIGVVTPLSSTHPDELRSLEEWVQKVHVINASTEQPDFTISDDGVKRSGVTSGPDNTGPGRRELDMSSESY